MLSVYIKIFIYTHIENGQHTKHLKVFHRKGKQIVFDYLQTENTALINSF